MAAASDTLSADQGVLHWTRRNDFLPGASVNEGRGAGYSVDEIWTDLATGDSHTKSQTFMHSDPGAPVDEQESWVSSGAIWVKDGETASGAPSVRQISAQSPATQPNPVEAVKQTLQRAEAGQADIANGDPIDGTPVVVVTERPTPETTVRTWLTRTKTPRIIRTTTAFTCNEGDNCDRPKGDGKSSTVDSNTLTVDWQVVSKSTETEQHLALPN